MKNRSIRFGRPASKKAPLPSSVTLKTESLSSDGRGVARLDGKTVFIEGALAHETIDARIVRQHSRFDEAEINSILTPSANRVEPACEHYQHCGGCQLQHLDASEQIVQKQQAVLELLARIGHCTPQQIAEPICSAPWHYRRTARIGLNQLQRNQEPIVGFRRRQSHKLLQVSDCEVLDARSQGLFDHLRQLLTDLPSAKSYTHAEITYGDTTVLLILRCKHTPDPQEQATLKAFAAQHALCVYLALDSGIQALTAPAEHHYSLLDQRLMLHFAPGDFLQVNPAVNEQMVKQALAWLNPTENDTVLDLFCGLGNFTLPLALQAKHVIGVEGAEEMVTRTSENAARNQINNVQVFQADLSADNRKQAWFKADYTKLLLDPPRTGAYELLQSLPARAKEILYISCEPAALARDSQVLISKGYTLARFGVMDMFPHTSHVESMALFVKAGK